MWDHFSICQWCPPNLLDRKQFQPTDHIPVQSTSPLGGNKTHDLRPTISDLDYSASGVVDPNTTQQCTAVTFQRNGSHHIDQHKGNLESIIKALVVPEQEIRIFLHHPSVQTYSIPPNHLTLPFTYLCTVCFLLLNATQRFSFIHVPCNRSCLIFYCEHTIPIQWTGLLFIWH